MSSLGPNTSRDLFGGTEIVRVGNQDRHDLLGTLLKLSVYIFSLVWGEVLNFKFPKHLSVMTQAAETDILSYFAFRLTELLTLRPTFA
jgi:hypothetical protein